MQNLRLYLDGDLPSKKYTIKGNKHVWKIVVKISALTKKPISFEVEKYLNDLSPD